MKPNALRSALVQALIASTVGSVSTASHAFFTTQTVEVREYVNDVSQRRILVTNPLEMISLQDGKSGWHPSGLLLRQLTVSGLSPVLGIKDVCRFYAPTTGSHFFTLNDTECTLLKTQPLGWNFVGTSFPAGEPDGEVCQSRFETNLPVHRLTRNGTHRYTPDTAERARLLAEGWTDERVAFCMSSWAYQFRINATEAKRVEQCRDEAGGPRPCIGVSGTPELSHAVYIGKYAPPLRADTTNYTGTAGDGLTPVQGYDGAEVLKHTFLQTNAGLAIAQYGIYLNGRDRKAGASSMNAEPLFKFVTTAPAAGATDLRLMPWRDRADAQLSFQFNTKIARVVLPDSSAQASTAYRLTLIDTTSRRSITVALPIMQTATSAADATSDHAVLDPRSGQAVVSTTFRANPAFGKTWRGNSYTCNPDVANDRCADDYNGPDYLFDLRASDMQYVLARARALDTALSADIRDYAVDSFSFRAEVSNDAELGLYVDSLSLYLNARD